MRIEIRSDSVTIDGYVNAVGRDSRPINSQMGKFVEMIEPGAFRAALNRAKRVDLLFNHDNARLLGSTTSGNLSLYEDNIGLRASCTITDPEVISKARSKKLRGWSFGMYVNADELEQRAEDIPRRKIKDLDIFEVSIIDDRLQPYYAGTSVECRADGVDALAETRANDFDNPALIVSAEENTISYDEYEKRISALAAD